MTDNADENFVQIHVSFVQDAEPFRAGDWIPQRNGISARFSDGSVELRGPWTGVMGKPLPDWLDRVVEPLLRDFQLPTPITLSLGFGKDHSGHDTLWIHDPADPGPGGFQIPDGVRGADLMLDLADRLQEQFFLETAEAWGQPRPPCPRPQPPGLRWDARRNTMLVLPRRPPACRADWPARLRGRLKTVAMRSAGL